MSSTSNSTQDKQFYFFWSGYLSNWAKSPFKSEGINYSCVEQYMMYQKAILFNDTKIAKKILDTSVPKQQKALGRKVSNFDPNIWNIKSDEIVYQGIKLKFEQNRKLLDLLLKTSPLELVEASPYDTIWGIGLSESDPRALDKSKWRGKNKLGILLTKYRDEKNKRVY